MDFMEIQRRHFETIGSTNSWAKEHCQEFDKTCLTIVTAGEQTEGRGRFKRSWISPKNKNIYATFCFFLEKRRFNLGNIPQILAISTAKMLERLSFDPVLKWPNDILLSHKKLAGILCETCIEGDHLFICLGIGLNVNMTQQELAQIDRPATSLHAEKNIPFDCEEILNHLTDIFIKDLKNFLEEGFIPFFHEYKKRLEFNKERLIQFSDHGALFSGYIDSLNIDGSINIKLSGGEFKRLLSGEIADH